MGRRQERAVWLRSGAAAWMLALAPLTPLAGLLAPLPVEAQQFPVFRQALAEGVAENEELSAFYREASYAPVWTGAEHAARRTALVSALSRAAEHGLPAARYDLPGLLAAFTAVQSERDRAMVEARASLTFLQYARDISSGVLEPSEIVQQIVRELPRPDAGRLMTDFVAAEPVSFIRNLAPSSPEYARLFRAKLQLEEVIATDAWGPEVQAGSLAPGDTGGAVIQLRNRLIAMGYMPRVATARYDGVMMRAVQEFQEAHGIEADGVAGQATIRQINVPAEDRLRAVVVAMERERWLNIPRGDRHIWVNLTDFTARIVDFDEVTFETVAVVGGQSQDTQTPEFSDRMEYLEINPDWTVPRSIVARSYWGGGMGGFQLIDSRGNVVPWETVDLSGYTPQTMPYELRMPPGPGNPLGEVKFMFPNPYAIYLHDSPARQLFSTVVRTHSSGCVRLQNPREFAYELLSRQEADPVTAYHSILSSRQQTRVSLQEPVPVHIVYRTAFTSIDGRLNFRNDVYNRDARLYEALVRAGVETGV